MFILLAFILSVISISLQLTASGLDLSNALMKRKSSGKKALNGAVRVGLTASSSALKLTAFLIDRVRDLVISVGMSVIVIDFVVLLVVVVSSYSYLSLL